MHARQPPGQQNLTGREVPRLFSFTVGATTLQIDLGGCSLKVQRDDDGFFRMRFERLTLAEKRYRRAIAELGRRPSLSKAIADQQNRKSNALVPLRDWRQHLRRAYPLADRLARGIDRMIETITFTEYFLTG